MLELVDINVFYGAIHALRGVHLKIQKGEIVTLIGANGAGKTTTLKTISGVLKPKSGKVLFEGKELQNVSAPEIVSLGISHVPEGRRIFGHMSVMENLEMGAYIRKDKNGIKKDYETVFGRFPRLLERKSQMAGTLSGGEQQMLAIGRALMSRPKLMILDEPSMGLAPLIVKDIFAIVQDINKEGTTVLVVEQNANMALKVANRAYIIKNGEIDLEGSAEELSSNDEVRKAYLGG